MSAHIPATLLVELKKNYPPRCRLPSETERDHERYAGKVELIAELEERHRDQIAPDIVVSPDGVVEPDLKGLTFDQAYGDDD